MHVPTVGKYMLMALPKFTKIYEHFGGWKKSYWKP